MTGDESAQRSGGGWDVPFSDELLSRLVHHLSALEVGERLPSERVLAETLGVSRTALRDRLMRLEAIGVVERRSGSGTYLRGLSSPMTGDTLAMGMMANNLDPGSMMPVRVALEREAGRQAARRGDHINLARMAVALDGMTHGVDDHGFREADRVFHDALVAASGVPGLQFFGEILRDILSVTVREVPLVERDHLYELHVEIYEAVRDGDPARAMRAVDGHFDWLENAIARGTFDDAG